MKSLVRRYINDECFDYECPRVGRTHKYGARNCVWLKCQEHNKIYPKGEKCDGCSKS